MQARTIILIGPESTGKSTLAGQLAKQLGACLISEYARDYVAQLGRAYTYEDVCTIAEQNRREMESAKGCTILDTDLILTKVWLDEVYHQRPDWIDRYLQDMAHSGRPILYLLLCPDIAWQADPTRENGDQTRREELFEIYRNEIEHYGFPYAIVKGEGPARFVCAQKAAMEALTTP